MSLLLFIITTLFYISVTQFQQLQKHMKASASCLGFGIGDVITPGSFF